MACAPSLPTARVVVFLVLTGLATPASGQRDVASELFRAGQAAFEAGDFGASARAFEEAYRAEPSSATAYNAALAWERSDEPAHAVDALERTLAGDVDVLDPALRTDAEAMLARLRPTIGYLVVEGPRGSSVDVSFHHARIAPVRLPLRPGRHLVRWRAGDGRADERFVEIGRGDVRLDLGSLDAESAGASDAPATHATSTAARPDPSPPGTRAMSSDESSRGSNVTPGVVLASAAVALGVGAAGLGIATLRERDAYLAGGRLDRGAYDRAIRLRSATNAVLATAVVMGVVGVVLWIVRARRGSREHASDEVSVWTF